MRITKAHHVITWRHRIAWRLILCLLGLWAYTAQAQRARSGGGDEKVYLEHADELFHDQFKKPGMQVAKGHVAFRHNGVRLRCDSAYFKQESNTFEAFGHVYMVQGDTLTLTSDYALYDGRPMVEMVYARKHVVVTHRKTSVLTTDSLNYDRKFNFVYYAEGGHYKDSKKNVDLVSDWGRYNLDTKEATCYYNVVLKSPEYEIRTDTLFYDADKERAQIVSKSTIYSKKNNYHVTSSNGYYYMSGESTELFDRSVIENDDRMMQGDSLYYDSKKKQSRGFGNVFYEDKKNKNTLTAGEFHYNELTGVGMATRNPVFTDYSQKDTLYLHCDTMRIKTYNIDTDSVYREVYCYNKVRAYRKDMQAVCDSMLMCSKDSSLTMYVDPIVWNANRQLLGEEIKVYMADSTIREAHVIGQALSIELMNDQTHYNQVTGNLMNAYFDAGNLTHSEVIGTVSLVFYPEDDKDSTLIGLNYTETDTLRMYVNDQRKLSRIWMSKAEGVLYPMTQIPKDKEYLPNFQWFDYIRPLHKDDIYEWRPKKPGTELKARKSTDRYRKR